MRRIRLKVAPKIGPNLTRSAKSESGAVQLEIKENADTGNEEVTPSTLGNKDPEQHIVEEQGSVVNAEVDKPAEIVSETIAIKSIQSNKSELIISSPAEHVNDKVQQVHEVSVPVQAVRDNISHPVSLTEETGLHSSRMKSRFTRARPNIERATHRVRTFSSASESEDEGRRLQRTRHHSLSSFPKNSLINKPPAQESSEKNGLDEDLSLNSEKPPSKKGKTEKTDLQLRKEATAKKLKSGKIEKSQLTMFDLIYYNPPGDGKDEKKKAARRQTRRNTVSNEESNEIIEERLAEEAEIEQIEQVDDAGKENVDESIDDGADAMPVPQVRVGADGQIILDEQSLVIETSEAKQKKASMQNAELVYETQPGLVNYGSWRKRKKSSPWTIKETARFYRALSMLGTDFSLMESLFPRRTRFELKKKFKIEEKVNRDLVDRIIKNQKPFDPMVFGEESGDSDDELENEISAEKEKKKAKKKAEKSKQSTEKPNEAPVVELDNQENTRMEET